MVKIILTKIWKYIWKISRKFWSTFCELFQQIFENFLIFCKTMWKYWEFWGNLKEIFWKFRKKFDKILEKIGSYFSGNWKTLLKNFLKRPG